MTLRTAPPARATPARATPARAVPAADPALDEALAHIGALSERLWAVRRLHAPSRSRSWRGRVRCAGCGQALPCPTLQAVAPGRR